MKYELLGEWEAWQEHKKGTPLFFGDGPSDRFQIEGQGTLIGVDYCSSIPFRATVPNCETEWFCNCWKEVK
jgi:hypothetical protein